jgi:hypothetical protein
MKAPKFEKELSFLVPYLFNEETRHSNIPLPSSLAHEKCEMDEVRSDHDVTNDTGTSTENTSDIAAPSPSPAPAPKHMNHLRKGNKYSENLCAASVLKEYLETKKKKDNEAATQDSLSAFFLNMAQMTKTFPLRDQIEIKRNLFEMVTSVEMRLANSQADQSFRGPSADT